MASLSILPTQMRSVQRVLIVAVALVPLTLVTLAWLPALITLPFLSDGVRRSERLARQLTSWTTVVLSGRVFSDSD